ncbi:MAG: gamma-glutamyltransferase [Acidobacteria bacterium]|nr:gamma-glutamyltransferase [Acidobacteriota bacterium]
MMNNSSRRSLSGAILVLILVVNSFTGFAQSASRQDTFRPPVRGTRGVVAGGHPLVVEAGLRMLHRGGNAVDAGVAATLAGSVIEFSHFAFGGERRSGDHRMATGAVVINGQGNRAGSCDQGIF